MVRAVGLHSSYQGLLNVASAGRSVQACSEATALLFRRVECATAARKASVARSKIANTTRIARTWRVPEKQVDMMALFLLLLASCQAPKFVSSLERSARMAVDCFVLTSEGRHRLRDNKNGTSSEIAKKTFSRSVQAAVGRFASRTLA